MRGMSSMNKKEVIEKLKSHKKEIKKFGVKKIGVFGSIVRNEGSKDSDIDFVVEFEKGAGTFKNFGGLVEYLENLFNRPVDILTPMGIESIRIKEIKESIKREVVYV